LTGAGLRHWSSYLCLPGRWDYRCDPPCPACFLLKWGLVNFLSRLILNLMLSNPEPGIIGGIIGGSHHTSSWIFPTNINLAFCIFTFGNMLSEPVHNYFWAPDYLGCNFKQDAKYLLFLRHWTVQDILNGEELY
jgi:hypothetical protein